MAKKIASFVMDTFGYELRIIDNILTPNERQIFYMLQTEGFLTTCREQTRLYDGREWVTHYWELNHSNIISYMQGTEQRNTSVTIEQPKRQTDKKTIYSEVTDEMWYTRRIFDNNIPHHL